MNQEEDNEDQGVRQGNISAPGDRRDYSIVSTALGIDITSYPGTSSSANMMITTNQGAIEYPPVQIGGTSLMANQTDETKDPHRKSGSNSDDSSSLGDKSFDSVVNMLMRREEEDQSIARENQNLRSSPQLPAPAWPQPQHYGGGYSTMLANLLAHSHRDPNLASKVWPASFSPGSQSASQRDPNKTFASSSTLHGEAASERTDMATVVAAAGREDQIAMVLSLTSYPFRVLFSTRAFNHMVGRDVVGEPFHHLFRLPSQLPMIHRHSAQETTLSPPLGVCNFLIDGRVARQVHVISVYSDANSGDRGLLYYRAAVVS